MSDNSVSLYFNEKKSEIKSASLNVWQGKWTPYREEIITAL